MPELDPLLLSRIQFAFTISFHILFPSFTIGLAAWLLVLEVLWLRTGKAIYADIAAHWTKIFAVSFGMGVVSGVVLSYEFGTNWSELSRLGGNVIGPLMSYEVLTAFFLEAGFLGIMLFGRNRVPKAVHLFATAMVALGTLISAFWILSANSWMQTPAGYTAGPDSVLTSPIGGRSSSTRPSPTASPIWPPPISPPLSSSRHRRLVHLARAERAPWADHARHGLEPACGSRRRSSSAICMG
jgi:cytochrome bd-type quinol oxidase subunit 1